MDSSRASSDEHNPNPDELTDQNNPTRVCWCEDPTNLMALIRSCLQEEMVMNNSRLTVMIDDAINRLILPRLQMSASPSTLSSSPNLSELSASRSLQLHFVGTFPDSFLTLENIQDESGSLVMVELRDASGSRVEVGPESCVKIQIVALDGDFEVVDRNDWTQDEFKKHFLTQRKQRRPLLIGDCEIFLSKGVAFIHKISFTDNSHWVKCGMFRLGAWIMEDVSPGVIVREAISEAFKVNERRKLSYQKSKAPTLEDKIWRLESIAKNGRISQRLADEANVHTVKDFLQLYHTNAKRLEEIVRVSPKNLAKIVQNAELCQLTNEHYQYYDETTEIELLLDCAFNIVSLRSTGHNSMPYESLKDSFKEFAHKLRETAYEKRSELLKINIPCSEMQYIDSTTANQGDQLLEDTFGNDDIDQMLAWDIDQMLNTEPLQEETDNYFEVPTEDKVASKLIAACYVTKAAILFMISIQQESTVPQKKRKLQ